MPSLKTTDEADWFAETSDDPYDRHIYQLVMKSGQTFMYEDYEILRNAWFNLSAMGNLDQVIVIDAQQFPS